MKIYSNYYTNNLQFYGHRIKYTNEQLSAILDPLFEQKLPFKKIMSISGLSPNVINKWAKDTKGMTANKLYHQSISDVHEEGLENKLRELRSAGNTCKQIGEIINHSTNWVCNRLKKYNINKELTQLQIKIRENIPWMIKEGYTLDAMAKELGCGSTYVSDLIIKTYGKNIKEIKHDINPGELSTKLLNKIRDNVPRMIHEGYTLEAMAKELGCGPTYVSNWIQKTYGKQIKRIRHENNIRIKIHP